MATLQEAVAYFLAERDDVIRAIENCPVTNMEDYWRWQGHAEARRVLRESLEREGIDLMAEPRPEATVKAEALEELARELDASAAEWSTPMPIPEGWDSHHIIVRGATQGALENAAKAARAKAGEPS